MSNPKGILQTKKTFIIVKGKEKGSLHLPHWDARTKLFS
jgi:hypothetical protein